MTLQEARQALGISRPRLMALLKEAGIPSRIELTPDGKAKRYLERHDVEKLLHERSAAAARQTGKGRPIKLPESGENPS